MPHIVIEYAADQLDGRALLASAFEATLASGLFGREDIKARLIPCQDYIDGGGERPFVHVSVHLLPGRSSEQRYNLDCRILEALSPLIPGPVSLSVESIEIDKPSYAKVVR
ncbi:5-carboxymethyl-2-hydroxymuconate Delta-isomerase [Pokkaliibacter sp. CJK22405]|uniref:5-carboxymethyl-2-hydroxymuconate Delta-isomerase n=1 Tax=Pokkaliibacter sp. CJK22405 TaxID=3384615 RepID=UPI0039846CB9